MTTHPVPIGTGRWQDSELSTTTAAPALPQRQPGRAAAIQGLRDYADWLDAHPDVPAPTTLDAHVHQYVDYETSLAVCRAFAASYGAKPHENGDTRWVTYTVPTTGLKVEHVVFAATAPRTGSWV